MTLGLIADPSLLQPDADRTSTQIGCKDALSRSAHHFQHREVHVLLSVAETRVPQTLADFQDAGAVLHQVARKGTGALRALTSPCRCQRALCEG